MAKVELNESLGALRGKIDGWVYRKQHGQTVVTSYTAPKSTKPTVAQKKARARFRAAHAYATEVLSDPLRRLVYQKLGAERKRPPNTLLASNFLTPPVIEKIDASAYAGRIGGMIRIVAFDAIAVAAVAVSIRSASGAVIEAGPAVNDHGVWNYCATANAPAGTPLQIVVSARNHARAEAEQCLETRSGAS